MLPNIEARALIVVEIKMLVFSVLKKLIELDWRSLEYSKKDSYFCVPFLKLEKDEKDISTFESEEKE